MKNMICAVFCLVFSSTIIVPATAAGDNLNTAYPSIDEAFTNIINAEKAGADVSTLIVKFDEALDLLQQAERSTFITCDSRESCVVKANDILDSVNRDSIFLQNKMEQTSALDRIMKLAVYSTLVAFTTSFAAILGYRTWKSQRLKNYFDMEIVENEK